MNDKTTIPVPAAAPVARPTMPSEPEALDRPEDVTDTSAAFAVHLLDVGPEEYGDAVLCQFGRTTVLIDGAHPGNWRDKGDDHPSIPTQIGQLLGLDEPPYPISLLVCTHAHQDHIGCLPTLVERDLVDAQWALVADPELGWGRSGESDVAPSHGLPEDVRRLVAALREEPRVEDDSVLQMFASDAVVLESRYNAMLRRLEDRGTRVVRYGRDARGLSELRERFRSIGLVVQGPSQRQLEACAALIRGTSADVAAGAVAAMARDPAADRPATFPEVYRRLAERALDRHHRDAPVVGSDAGFADAVRKGRGAVNNQSIVTRFKFRGQKILFLGDMQLADPQVANEDVKREMEALRATLSNDGPYALVKLPHHGSDNGMSREIFDELGRPALIGICTGAASRHHPHPDVLEWLAELPRGHRWVRTDRNGRTSMTFNGDEVTIARSRGKPNDPVPNADTRPAAVAAGVFSPPVVVESPGGAPPSAANEPGRVPATMEVRREEGASRDWVEVRARIPHVGTRVTITVDVEPRFPAQIATARTSGGTPPGHPTSPADSEAGQQQPHSASAGRKIRLGGGRVLPPLTFVTHGSRLANNVGEAEAQAVFEAIRAAGQVVVDLAQTPKGAHVAAEYAEFVRDALSRQPGQRGVVIVGGYDVVPPQQIDVLPRRLRQLLKHNSDDDDFIVWSDDVYGDVDGNGLPELPVSRIPDGRSRELLFNALEAPAAPESHAHRCGIRNSKRPFADSVFRNLAGTAELFQSEPVLEAQPYVLDGERVYVMLHGTDEDASVFFGESAGDDPDPYPRAMGVRHAHTTRPGAVVLSGCCWGALTVDTRAAFVTPRRQPAPRPPEGSIALAFLMRGARAFVGCTGVHYSPRGTDADYFGGPMHRQFWAGYERGLAPAEALFDAKRQYALEMPHGREVNSSAEAIEFKILRQFTCLGLGW